MGSCGPLGLSDSLENSMDDFLDFFNALGFETETVDTFLTQ
jgi:hypothetical protein